MNELKPCPDKPNCVCSKATDARHAIEPLRLAAPAHEAWRALLDVLASWPRIRLVEQNDNYLHAEARSLIFRFVDDLECLMDAGAGVIHVRSASRTGHGDMGVNRKRVEALRGALVARGVVG